MTGRAKQGETTEAETNRTVAKESKQKREREGERAQESATLALTALRLRLLFAVVGIVSFI